MYEKSAQAELEMMQNLRIFHDAPRESQLCQCRELFADSDNFCCTLCHVWTHCELCSHDFCRELCGLHSDFSLGSLVNKFSDFDMTILSFYFSIFSIFGFDLGSQKWTLKLSLRFEKLVFFVLVCYKRLKYLRF